MALQDASLSASAVGCLEMHGTGTPLGDPIEVGAAAAVFSSGRATPLCLAAAKSVLGHTEPAAGATGMARAILRCAATLPQSGVCHSVVLSTSHRCLQTHRCVCRMGQGLTSGILHLSAVNPYIASTLRPAAAAAPTLPVHLPRQPAGAAVAEGNAVTGISGFAFQGTNAHVILGR